MRVEYDAAREQKNKSQQYKKPEQNASTKQPSTANQQRHKKPDTTKQQPDQCTQTNASSRKHKSNKKLSLLEEILLFYLVSGIVALLIVGIKKLVSPNLRNVLLLFMRVDRK